MSRGVTELFWISLNLQDSILRNILKILCLKVYQLPIILNNSVQPLYQTRTGEQERKLKETLIKMIERGQLLNEKQARMAFSSYLTMVLQHLREFDDDVDDKNKCELTLRFLQKV